MKVGERPHRRRWREHLDDVGHDPPLRSRPAAEGEREHAGRDVGNAGDLVTRSLTLAREHNVVVMVPEIYHLTTAIPMYRDMGMTYWLEKSEAEPSFALPRTATAVEPSANAGLLVEDDDDAREPCAPS